MTSFDLLPKTKEEAEAAFERQERIRAIEDESRRQLESIELLPQKTAWKKARTCLPADLTEAEAVVLMIEEMVLDDRGSGIGFWQKYKREDFFVVCSVNHQFRAMDWKCALAKAYLWWRAWSDTRKKFAEVED